MVDMRQWPVGTVVRLKRSHGRDRRPTTIRQHYTQEGCGGVRLAEEREGFESWNIDALEKIQ